MPTLLRRSAGAILPNRTYVLDKESVTELRKLGIRFITLSQDSSASSLEGVGAGERV